MPLGVRDGDAPSVSELVPVGVPDCVLEPDAVGVGVVLGVPVPVSDGAGVLLGDAPTVRDAVLEMVHVLEGVPERVPLAVEVADGVGVGVGELVPDGVDVVLGDPDADVVPVNETVGVPDGVTDADALTVRLAVGEGVSEGVVDVVGDCVAFVVGVGVIEPDGVPETLGVGVSDGVPEPVPEGVRVDEIVDVGVLELEKPGDGEVDGVAERPMMVASGGRARAEAPVSFEAKFPAKEASETSECTAS